MSIYNKKLQLLLAFVSKFWLWLFHIYATVFSGTFKIYYRIVIIVYNDYIYFSDRKRKYKILEEIDL